MAKLGLLRSPLFSPSAANNIECHSSTADFSLYEQALSSFFTFTVVLQLCLLFPLTTFALTSHLYSGSENPIFTGLPRLIAFQQMRPHIRRISLCLNVSDAISVLSQHLEPLDQFYVN
jgi:hypothetical protein